MRRMLIVGCLLFSVSGSSVVVAYDLGYLTSAIEVLEYLRHEYGRNDGDTFYNEIAATCHVNSGRQGEWVDIGVGWDHPAFRIDRTCGSSDQRCGGYFYPDNREVWEEIRIEIPCGPE